jgi:glycosyltransferase involved in cell wall biosynthesis
MKQKSELIYIGFAFKHHKKTHAGYHHIKDYLHYDRIINCQWEHESLNYPSKTLLKKILKKVYKLTFGRVYIFAIIRCILLGSFLDNKVFHFVYAENSYKWLHLFIRKSNRIVCTYHQPFEYIYNNRLWISDIKKVHRVILMSQKDVTLFKEITCKNNVFFIPHGINTSFYSLGLNKKKRHNILMVGNWLRDFEFARSVFDALLIKYENLSVSVVANNINLSYFQDNDRIECLEGITDEHLRTLYHTTKCVFLPLKSFTANNTILEAASTGCQIVVATDNGDTSYFGDKRIPLIPLDHDIVFKYLCEILESNFNHSKSIALSSFVKENYSWESIAKKTKKVLEL